MKKFLSTDIGRLRLIAFMEGLSLLILIFIGVPLKHYFGDAALVEFMGPVHGAIFLLFIFNALRVAIEYNWKFSKVTWKLLVASLVPFGTFYIDNTILRPAHNDDEKSK